jgi:hypothetical protein
MQAATTEHLMRPRGVVPMNPVGTRTSGFGEVAEVMLPDTLLLEATKAETTSGVILDNPHLYEPVSGPGREFGLCEAGSVRSCDAPPRPRSRGSFVRHEEVGKHHALIIDATHDYEPTAG